MASDLQPRIHVCRPSGYSNISTARRGGAEIQALDICRNAARYGLEITLATGHRGPLDDEFISTGIRFVPLERRAPIDLFLVSHLRRLIREYEIDIVHGYQPVDGIHLYLAARRMQSVRRIEFPGIYPG